MIKQVFHLPEELNEKLKKNMEDKPSQLEVEIAVRILQEQCNLDDIESELNTIDSIAQIIINQYNKAIIVGIGGAILASRSFVATKNYKSNNFSLIYSDSLSNKKQEDIFTHDNLKSSAIIIISKSGNSIETISQAYSIMNKYKSFFGDKYLLGKHFFLITSKTNSRLSNLGDKIKATFIEYKSNSGKFSSFAAGGLLPAKLIGLNSEKIIQGALKSFEHCVDAVNSAHVSYSLMKEGYDISVMSYYNDLLDQLSFWYSQISSEIIAKLGKGFTPITTRGIFDQHGLWQLLLSGPCDKYFTILRDKSDCNDNKLNKKIEDNYHKLTIKRLKERNFPMRELIIDKLDEKTLGYLSMNFLTELTLLAVMLDICPLTHPIIDQSKKVMNYLIKDSDIIDSFRELS